MDLLEVMHQSSARYGADVSEFEALSLAAIQCETIDAPRPKAAKVSMECRLHDAIDLGNTHLILARVLAFHIDDGLVQDGAIDPKRLSPVARLGGNYAELGLIHDLSRPEV